MTLRVRSSRWQVCPCGGVSNTVGLGAWQAQVLAFKNQHAGDAWFYLWLACGAGIGVGLTDLPNVPGGAWQTLMAIYGAAELPGTGWSDLDCIVPFSSEDLNGAVCESASFSSGLWVGGEVGRMQIRNRYEFHNARGRTVDFRMTRLASLPIAGMVNSVGADAQAIGGPLMRIWP